MTVVRLMAPYSNVINRFSHQTWSTRSQTGRRERRRKAKKTVTTVMLFPHLTAALHSKPDKQAIADKPPKYTVKHQRAI